MNIKFHRTVFVKDITP